MTVPDGWQNHLPWASMELAILTFGPGKIALDYVLGLDSSVEAALIGPYFSFVGRARRRSACFWLLAEIR